MTYLHDKLSSLYGERADLLEQIQRAMTEPHMVDRLKAAAESPTRGNAAMAELIMATMPAKVAIDRLKEEINWVERQIVAILGNPGLASAEGDCG